MRHFTALIIALLCAHSALAQLITVEKTLFCADTQESLATLQQRYGERVHWWKVTESGTVVAALENPRTGSWTLVQFTEQTLCVLEAGGISTKEPSL